MALKLRRLGVANRDIDQDTVEIHKPQQKTAEKSWYGRPVPPPPPGSGYSDFLDWASHEAFEPSENDVSLAMTLWMGKTPTDKDEADEPPTIKM